MSSNLTLSLATSKNAYPSTQIPSPAQSQSGSSPASEVHTQKRSGGSGSFGAAAAARSTSYTARNNQVLRKQHKGQHRPRLADEDAAAESAALQSTSSKKGRTSITHLMNFTLPPRPQTHQQTHFGRNAKRNPTWGLGSGYHAADKARYIHANYRFIVNPRGDYRAQATDADMHLDWNNVLQILVSTQSQSSNCPICLSSPVGSRMAKCGHIFCLPCLIRFMHSLDDVNAHPEKKARWKKCPICWDSIYISETRPVRWFTGQEGERPHDGGDVVLRLIVRQTGNILALPRDGAETLDKFEDIPWYFAAEVMDYARIMKGSQDYMMEQYDNEIEQLQLQEKEDELMFGEESPWTRKAVASILDAKEKTNGIGNPPSAPTQPSERKARRPPIKYDGDNEGIIQYYDLQHAAKSGRSTSRVSHVIPDHASISSTDNARAALSSEPYDIPISKQRGSSRSLNPATASSAPSHLSSSTPHMEETTTACQHRSHSSTPLFFYEALHHFYLSALDIRILKAAFGDYPSFPSTILPRVERISTGHIVDDELRRRGKYLAHLPQGCEVGFLECDWTDVVVPEVLSKFTEDIALRRKKNREKALREEKARVRAEKEEDEKRWASARRKRPSITHDIVSEADFQPLIEPSPGDFASSSSSPPWAASRSQKGSAFASLASPSGSPSAAKTVWGTRMIVSSSPPMAPSSQDLAASEDDGWAQHWERDLLDEEDLAAQIQASTIEPQSSKQNTRNNNSRKRKGKKITLMTTNARRGA